MYSKIHFTLILVCTELQINWPEHKYTHAILSSVPHPQFNCSMHLLVNIKQQRGNKRSHTLYTVSQDTLKEKSD